MTLRYVAFQLIDEKTRGQKSRDTVSLKRAFIRKNSQLPWSNSAEVNLACFQSKLLGEFEAIVETALTLYSGA
jgi:hypothetical protein